MKIPNSDSGEVLRWQAWPWSLVGIQICLEIHERLRKYLFSLSGSVAIELTNLKFCEVNKLLPDPVTLFNYVTFHNFTINDQKSSIYR